MPRFLPILLSLALLVPRGAVAQYAATQDASLRGLRRVTLYVSVNADDLPADSATALAERVRIELGKAGLILVPELAEPPIRPEAIVRVALNSTARGRWVDDLSLRLQVEQTATIPRTGDALRMVTWYTEYNDIDIAAAELPAHARVLVDRGLNRFLKAWLAVNAH